MNEDEEFEALEQRLNYKPVVKEDLRTKALKLALEALEILGWHPTEEAMDYRDNAIDAIYKALAKQSHNGMFFGTERPTFTAGGQPLAEQPAQQECNHCGGTGDVSGEYPGVACPECSGSGVQAQPEFIKHEVENAYDWSEWVCPDPESYLMKCCDCGLVHEAQFRVAKYKPAPSDECQVVSDPDLQAQFRMRRSEQWSPKDMAYRPGGLPLAEQPAQQQEPVAWITQNGKGWLRWHKPEDNNTDSVPLYTSPPAQRKPLTDEQIMEMYNEPRSDAEMIAFARAIEAAHGIGEQK